MRLWRGTRTQVRHLLLGFQLVGALFEFSREKVHTGPHLAVRHDGHEVANLRRARPGLGGVEHSFRLWTAFHNMNNPRYVILFNRTRPESGYLLAYRPYKAE